MLILVFKKIRNLRIGLEMKFEKSVAKKDCLYISNSENKQKNNKTNQQTKKQRYYTYISYMKLGSGLSLQSC